MIKKPTPPPTEEREEGSAYRYPKKSEPKTTIVVKSNSYSVYETIIMDKETGKQIDGVTRLEIVLDAVGMQRSLILYINKFEFDGTFFQEERKFV